MRWCKQSHGEAGRELKPPASTPAELPDDRGCPSAPASTTWREPSRKPSASQEKRNRYGVKWLEFVVVSYVALGNTDILWPLGHQRSPGEC